MIRRAGAALLAAGLCLPAAVAPAAVAAPSSAVSITVDSVSPSVPPPTQALHKLRFTLTVTNHTPTPLHGVEITAVRGFPIGDQASLDEALLRPSAAGAGLPVASLAPVRVDLPAGNVSAGVSATFVTTTSISLSAGLCLCANRAVYPLWFRAYGTTGGVPQLLGSTETFVPSFYQRPPATSVSWVWPLIDRPHRLVSPTTFTDDSLAVSVSTGRLSRCLDVLARVAPRVPLTVVIDPELLDELEIMATGSYRYQTPSGQLLPGTGRTAAAGWLAKLQAVLRDNPQVAVALTPLADPDVDAVARAGLSWSNTLPADVAHRVTAALGGAAVTSSFAWPPSGTIGRGTLGLLSASGVTSVLLSTSAVRRQVAPDGAPLTLARLPDGSSPVVAGLVSSGLSRYAAAAVGSTPGTAGLPQLMAEIAIRDSASLVAGKQVFLAPPRYVDPAVTLAARAIRATSSSVLTRPANLLDVLGAAGATPSRPGASAVPTTLRHRPGQRGGLPPVDTRVADSVTNTIAPLRAMFAGSAAGESLVGDLPLAVQRIESAAWRRGTGLGGRATGVKYARQLRQQVHGLTTGVHIVQPASGSYTLASANSPLPITVENDLNYPVHVKVVVRTVNGLPGLDAGEAGPAQIDARSKATLHVPTVVQRSGRIPVRAFLVTPDGHRLGPRVRLSVHSTVLGTIGVVITVVSGAILLLALSIRFVRRWRARRKRGRRPHRRPPDRPDEYVPAASPPPPAGALTESLATRGATAPPPRDH